MLRVYLDLNKWVDLSRAIGQKPGGERFHAAATMIRAAVEQGQASFPLSIGHYVETWKKRSAAQRHELAQTMAAVSCNHAIAPHAELLPGELDRALQRRFGRLRRRVRCSRSVGGSRTAQAGSRRRHPKQCVLWYSTQTVVSGRTS